MKGVYTALCFDELEIWQFLIPVNDNATVDAQWYDYIQSQPMSYAIGLCGLFISAWASDALLVLTGKGNARAPNS